MLRFFILIAISTTLGALVLLLWGWAAASSRLHTLSTRAQLAQTRHGPLEYALAGGGPTVLVIHGAGGGFDQGELIATHFIAPCFRILAVSRFGYLGTPMPSDASPMSQADALADLLLTLETGQVGVFAMSGGVPPAIELARRHPDLFSGLVLLSSAPFGSMPDPAANRAVPPWVFRAFFASELPFAAMARLRPALLRQIFDARPDLMADAALEDRALVDALIAAFPPVTHRRAGLANERAALDPAVGHALSMIKLPVLVVHAEDDTITPVSVADHLANHLPDARLMRFAAGGHLLIGHGAEIRNAASNHLLHGNGSSDDDPYQLCPG